MIKQTDEQKREYQRKWREDNADYIAKKRAERALAKKRAGGGSSQALKIGHAFTILTPAQEKEL